MLRINLPEGWGKANFYSNPFKTTAIRSYLSDKGMLSWEVLQSDYKYACDIESQTNKFVANYFSVALEDFTKVWVIAEVLAKLNQIPMFIFLKSYGLRNYACKVGEINQLPDNIEVFIIKIPEKQAYSCFGRKKI